MMQAAAGQRDDTASRTSHAECPSLAPENAVEEESAMDVEAAASSSKRRHPVGSGQYYSSRQHLLHTSFFNGKSLLYVGCLWYLTYLDLKDPLLGVTEGQAPSTVSRTESKMEE